MTSMDVGPTHRYHCRPFDEESLADGVVAHTVGLYMAQLPEPELNDTSHFAWAQSPPQTPLVLLTDSLPLS